MQSSNILASPRRPVAINSPSPNNLLIVLVENAILVFLLTQHYNFASILAAHSLLLVMISKRRVKFFEKFVNLLKQLKKMLKQSKSSKQSLRFWAGHLSAIPAAMPGLRPPDTGCPPPQAGCGCPLRPRPPGGPGPRGCRPRLRIPRPDGAPSGSRRPRPRRVR